MTLLDGGKGGNSVRMYTCDFRQAEAACVNAHKPLSIVLARKVHFGDRLAVSLVGLSFGAILRDSCGWLEWQVREERMGGTSESAAPFRNCRDFWDELPPVVSMIFPPAHKIAIFTWNGATVELDGTAEVAYVADEMRNRASRKTDSGEGNSPEGETRAGNADSSPGVQPGGRRILRSMTGRNNSIVERAEEENMVNGGDKTNGSIADLEETPRKRKGSRNCQVDRGSIDRKPPRASSLHFPQTEENSFTSNSSQDEDRAENNLTSVENGSYDNAVGFSYSRDEPCAVNNVGSSPSDEAMGQRSSRTTTATRISIGETAAEENTGAREDQTNNNTTSPEEISRERKGKRKFVDDDEGMRDAEAMVTGRADTPAICEGRMFAEIDNGSNINAERDRSAGDENRVQGCPENGRNVITIGEEVKRDRKGKGKLSYTTTIPGSSRGTSVENSLRFEGSINLGHDDGMGMMAAAGEFDVDDEGEGNGMVDMDIELRMDERVEMDIEVVFSDSEGERRRETRRLSRQRRAALRRAELVQNPNNGAGRNEAALAANRRRALDIARSRAAHFAHFNAPDDVDGANAVPVPSPSQQGQHLRRVGELLLEVRAQTQPEQQNANRAADREDWPGPWTVARNLVERRFAAAAARQEAAPPGATRPSLVNWKPSRTPDFTKNRVPASLHRICLDKLCGDIDHVVSLEGVPDEDKKLIIQGLCALRKITPATTKLCVSASPTEVVIPDCTCLTEEDFIDTLSSRSLERLEALELTMCGRGITDHCLATICAKVGNSFPELQTLVLKGAYRLVDQGVTRMLKTAPNLRSVDLTQCSLITESSVEAIADALGKGLESLVLDSCSQLNGIKLLPALLKMPHLRKLRLSRIPDVTDGVISELLVPLRFTLQELGLCHCQSLSDAGMQAVSLCQGLQMLDLGHIPSLTDVAIGLVADNCRNIKTLRLCRGKFSDTAVAAFVSASGSSLSELSLNSTRLIGEHTIIALAHFSKDSLERLDVSWCRLVSDQALGLLADSCRKLQSLRVFGCTQVTNLFLEGHSNNTLKVTGLWEGPSACGR
ncbi:hypothetical protein R1sor_013821 [Riccia sorocarpa]|uniref:Uncharacterized protein n=1 Tax=Riccia sorocarpa TaxID=122646 RepID=A0ABD3H7P5_9MARC